jgi:hypothetical protein
MTGEPFRVLALITGIPIGAGLDEAALFGRSQG